MTATPRKLRLQAENLTDRLFAAQGYRRTDLQRRAELRAMRRHNLDLAANPNPSLRPYLPEHFAAIRAEMGNANA